MRILTTGGKEYQIEFSFDTAEYKVCVDKVFKMVSSDCIMKHGITGEEKRTEMARAMIDGTADMISDMMSLSITCFYTGLLEDDPVEDEKVVRQSSKQFVRGNPDGDRASFPGVYEFLKGYMEENGPFKLAGLDKYLKDTSETMEETMKEAEEGTGQPTLPKVPTDRRKKSASTK